MTELFSYFLISLAFAEGVIAVLLIQLIRRHTVDKKAFLESERETYKTLETIITQTTRDSQAVMEQTLEAQKKVATSLQSFERILEKELVAITETFAKNLEQTGTQQLSQVTKKLESQLDTQSKLLFNEAQTQSQQFNKQTELLIKEYRQLLATQAANNLKQTRESLDALMAQEKTRIASESEAIIHKVSQRYFAQAAAPEDVHAVVVKLIESEL